MPLCEYFTIDAYFGLYDCFYLGNRMILKYITIGLKSNYRRFIICLLCMVPAVIWNIFKQIKKNYHSLFKVFSSSLSSVGFKRDFIKLGQKMKQFCKLFLRIQTMLISSGFVYPLQNSHLCPTYHRIIQQVKKNQCFQVNLLKGL